LLSSGALGDPGPHIALAFLTDLQNLPLYRMLKLPVPLAERLLRNSPHASMPHLRFTQFWTLSLRKTSNLFFKDA